MSSACQLGVSPEARCELGEYCFSYVYSLKFDGWLFG